MDMAIKEGDKVSLDYEGRLDSGELFDTSKHGDHSHPLEFTVGAGEVIVGFEEAVKGMEKGEEKEFSLSPEKAYGERREDMLKEVPKEALPKDQEAKVGMTLILSSPEGQQVPAKIAEVKENSIILDLNHPLAGQNLNFKIKILDVSN